MQLKFLAMKRPVVAAILFIACLFASPSLPVCQAQGQQADQPQRTYAPITVVPFAVAADSGAYADYTAASNLADALIRYLGNLGVPVVGSGVRAQGMTQDAMLTLLQQMSDEAAVGRLRARYVLTGVITNTKFSGNGLLQSMKLEAALRDVHTTQPVRQMTVTMGDKADLLAIAKNAILPSFLRKGARDIDLHTQNTLLAKTAEKLAKEVVANYPEGSAEDDPLARPARWSLTASGGSDADAARQAVQTVTDKLATTSGLRAHASQVRSDIVDAATRYAQVDAKTHTVTVYLTPAPGQQRATVPGTLREMGILRPLRVIVVSVKAPPPAAVLAAANPGRRGGVPTTDAAGSDVDDVGPAQAELIKRLQQAGFDLRSQEREKQLRDAQAFSELLKPDPDPETIRGLRKNANADVVLVVKVSGEPANALAQYGSTVQAEAWVGVTGYRLDNAKIVVASNWSYPGRGLTPQAAQLDAIKNATDANAPDVIEGLFKGGYSDTGSDSYGSSVADSGASKLTVTGWSSYTEARGFINALKGVTGVKVTDSHYADGRLALTVATDANVDLGEALERNSALRRYRITVKSVDGKDIKAAVKP